MVWKKKRDVKKIESLIVEGLIEVVEALVVNIEIEYCSLRTALGASNWGSDPSKVSTATTK